MSQSSDINLPINQSQIVLEPPVQHPLTPLELLLDKVDGQGAYQFRSFLIFNLMWFVTGWLLLGEAFFYDDVYTCNSTQDHKTCQELVCSLDEQQRLLEIATHANSIVFAFQPTYLICELSGITTVLTSMIFIGSLLGFFTIPYFADNWGRKIAIRAAWLICTLGVAFCAFASSPSMVGIGYFLAGFGANPAITLCYSFINEQCLGRSRQRYGVIIQVSYAIGESTIGLLFIEQLGMSWREIMFIVLALAVAVDLLLLYLVETPKFLIKKSQKKTLSAFNEMARKNNRPELILQYISQLKIEQQKCVDDSSSDQDSDCNHRELSNNDAGDEIHMQVCNRLRRREQVQSASLMLLFRYKSLFWKSIGVGAGFLGIQVIYYCTSFNLDEAGYGKLINQEIIGVSEICGYVAGEVLISRLERRRVSLWGMVVSSGICLLLAGLNMFKEENEDLVRVLGVVGLVLNRFVLCCFWSIFYVYIAQLFPTKVRSLAFGWASAVGTIGSTLTPYLIYFSRSLRIDSWLLPGAIGLLTAVFLIKLPETFRKPSLDFIQEEEELRINSD